MTFHAAKKSKGICTLSQLVLFKWILIDACGYYFYGFVLSSRNNPPARRDKMRRCKQNITLVREAIGIYGTEFRPN